jgi:hypothetical protein
LPTTKNKHSLQIRRTHPSDVSLIGLYSTSTQTKVSLCVKEKTKINHILHKPSSSPYRIPFISQAYKKQKRLGFVKGRQLTYGFGEMKMT